MPLRTRQLVVGTAVLNAWCLAMTGLGAPAGALERPGAAPAAGSADPGAPTAAFVSDSMGSTARPEITAEVTKDRSLSYLSTIQGANIADHRADLVALTRGPGGPDYLVVMLGTAQANNPPPTTTTMPTTTPSTTAPAPPTTAPAPPTTTAAPTGATALQP